MSALVSIFLTTAAVPAQVDPGLASACGEDPGSLCEWVFDQTGNETLAKISDWLVGTPLTVRLTAPLMITIEKQEDGALE